MQNPKRYAEIAIDACQLPVVPDESKKIINAARETPCELKVVWDQKQHTIDRCNQAKFQKWNFLNLFFSNHPIFQQKSVTSLIEPEAKCSSASNRGKRWCSNEKSPMPMCSWKCWKCSTTPWENWQGIQKKSLEDDFPVHFPGCPKQDITRQTSWIFSNLLPRWQEDRNHDSQSTDLT